ncbi:MAG TPA: transcription antitermination factor NusB [Gammaproteobacteria bacterium]|nr:transcription antitermination factor NusB [Gammaproteobacteria bacterium]
MSEASLAKRRSSAREKAMQALYQWTISGSELSDIEVQFHAEQNMAKVDLEYFHELLHGVPAQLAEIDAMLAPFMSRQDEMLDHVEQAILRLSAWELRNRPDVPYQVVIKEAIHLARAFGAAQSHKFINGVLDSLARQCRTIETGK